MLDRVPDGQADRERDQHDPAAVDRQVHEAEVQAALQGGGRQERLPRHAVEVAKDGFDHERQPEGEQPAVDVVHLVEAGEHRLLDDHAEGSDEERREEQRDPVGNGGELQEQVGREGPRHVEGAVGEVDDVQHPEDDGEPQAQQGVEGAVDEPEQELSEQRFEGQTQDGYHAARGRSRGTRSRSRAAPRPFPDPGASAGSRRAWAPRRPSGDRRPSSRLPVASTVSPWWTRQSPGSISHWWNSSSARIASMSGIRAGPPGSGHRQEACGRNRWFQRCEPFTYSTAPFARHGVERAPDARDLVARDGPVGNIVVPGGAVARARFLTRIWSNNRFTRAAPSSRARARRRVETTTGTGHRPPR